jgi:hypothetical protein
MFTFFLFLKFPGKNSKFTPDPINCLLLQVIVLWSFSFNFLWGIGLSEEDLPFPSLGREAENQTDDQKEGSCHIV